MQALRFVAAFAVVCVHSSFYAHERLAPGLPIYRQGANGVRLFFVISGFVMILSSERLVGKPRGWAILAVLGLLGLFLPVDLPVMPALARSLIITTLSASTIVAAVALEPRIGARIQRWAVFMGAASCALYLIHPMIAPAAPVMLTKLHLPSPWLSVPASILIASVGGALVYRFVETPMSRQLNIWVRHTRLMGPAPHIGGLGPEENVPGGPAPDHTAGERDRTPPLPPVR